MRKRTRELERMRGRGIVTEDTGKTYPVTYDLSRTQDEVDLGLDEPPLRTKKNVIGRILPVVSFEGFKTLQMDDGRRLKFFYTNSDGTMALNEWIG